MLTLQLVSVVGGAFTVGVSIARTVNSPPPIHVSRQSAFNKLITTRQPLSRLHMHTTSQQVLLQIRRHAYALPRSPGGQCCCLSMRYAPHVLAVCSGAHVVNIRVCVCLCPFQRCVGMLKFNAAMLMRTHMRMCCLHLCVTACVCVVAACAAGGERKGADSFGARSTGGATPAQLQVPSTLLCCAPGDEVTRLDCHPAATCIALGRTKRTWHCCCQTDGCRVCSTHDVFSGGHRSLGGSCKSCALLPERPHLHCCQSVLSAAEDALAVPRRHSDSGHPPQMPHCAGRCSSSHRTHEAWWCSSWAPAMATSPSSLALTSASSCALTLPAAPCQLSCG
jgi:hypothetical protein